MMSASAPHLYMCYLNDRSDCSKGTGRCGQVDAAERMRMPRLLFSPLYRKQLKAYIRRGGGSRRAVMRIAAVAHARPCGREQALHNSYSTLGVMEKGGPNSARCMFL